MRPGRSAQEPAVWLGREGASFKVSPAPGAEAQVRGRNDAVPPSVRSRVFSTERQAAPPGASLQSRPAAAAERRHALYRVRAPYSPNAFRSSVYGATGRTVDTVRSGRTLMRRRYGFGSRWHFSRVSDGGMGTVRRTVAQGSAAGGGTMMERATRETLTLGAARQDPGNHSGATADSLRVAARERRYRVRCVRRDRHPDGRFAVVDRSPAPAWSLSAPGCVSTRTMVAMTHATECRDSWVRLPARKGRRPDIRAGAAVRGGDIAALCAAWTAGTRARAESYAESVSCGEFGRCGARPERAVLLAIAVDIASKTVNAGAARACEHPARRTPALPLAVTQRFDNRKVYSCFGNSSRTCRPPEAAPTVRRFYSR